MAFTGPQSEIEFPDAPNSILLEGSGLDERCASCDVINLGTRELLPKFLPGSLLAKMAKQLPRMPIRSRLEPVVRHVRRFFAPALDEFLVFDLKMEEVRLLSSPLDVFSNLVTR